MSQLSREGHSGDGAGHISCWVTVESVMVISESGGFTVESDRVTFEWGASLRSRCRSQWSQGGGVHGGVGAGHCGVEVEYC